MECVRRVINSNDLNPFLMLPRSFSNRKVEVLITPIEEKMSDNSDFIDYCLKDAYSRYKVVNGKDSEVEIPKELLLALKEIAYDEKPLISIRDNSLKVVLFKNEKKYTIDFKSICPDIVMVSNLYTDSDGNRTMNINEVKISALSDFFEAA